MRRLPVVLAILLAVPAVAVAASSKARVSVVAWASTTSRTAIPPKDAVPRGTYCAPKPIRRLYAFIKFNGMKNKVASSATWYYEGDKVFVFNFKWNDGAYGRTAFDLYRTKGALDEGGYKIEIRSGGGLLATGSVELKFAPCGR